IQSPVSIAWAGTSRAYLRVSNSPSTLSQRSCGVPTFAGSDSSGRSLDYAGVVGAAVPTIPFLRAGARRPGNCGSAQCLREEGAFPVPRPISLLPPGADGRIGADSTDGR